MAIQQDYWKYFLTQSATGLCYWEDSTGNVNLGNVMTGVDYSLPEHPQGWEDITIMWGKNQTYWGLNRSFSVPLTFVKTGARILRKLYYKGKGIQQPITLVVLKWNPDAGYFDLYYKGQLDLTQNVDIVAESFQVNVMEGGILQLLKNYENAIVEIPCDGSLPQNIKVLADGIEFNDTFNYTILKLKSPYAGEQPLPCTFISNSGDNVGITHGDQELDLPYANYVQKSSNFLFSSLYPVTIRIVGSISVMADQLNPVSNTSFYMYATTSFNQSDGVDGGVSNSVGLVTPQPGPIFTPRNSQTIVNGQKTFGFDATISLQPGENLFILFFNDFTASPINILGGSFRIIFSSRQLPSRVWGITAWDVWQILGQKLNALSTTSDYVFNYAFTSNLLQQFLNFVITSGDATRASTDPDYFQYFNQATINPQNPNNPNFTQYQSLGPVIKISLADFFQSLNAVLCAAIGNQLDANGNDSIFLEERQYVLDSSRVTLTLFEVSNFKVSVDTDNFFNWFEIGYPSQSYDQQSGKYEYNNTSAFQAPINTIAKVLSLVSKIRADSYGFEFIRYNINGGNSTTNNAGDSDLFFLNTSFASFIYDYYSALFTSSITDIDSLYNTNIYLQKVLNYQPFVFGTLDGEYFTDNVDFSIFMFNETPGIQPYVVEFNAFLNGIIGDSATITFYINGVIIKQWTTAVTQTNTVLASTLLGTRIFELGDNFYFTVSTIKTCTVQINSFSINVGSGYVIAQNAGPINIAAGSTQQLISLPIITANTYQNPGGITMQVVSYGYQYFTFLSSVAESTFSWSLWVKGIILGTPGQFAEFDLWKNGVKIGAVSYQGSGESNGGFTQITFNPNQVPQMSGVDTYNLYDVLWMTCSCANVDCYVTGAQLLFTSTTIKAYNLKRASYSNVSGIPNPETAFNIEDLTPMRMLQRNGPVLASVLSMIGGGALTFQTADKNQFLSTTLNGITITENSSIDISDLGDPLWMPLIFDFDTNVPMTAQQIFNYAHNGHIAFPYNGKMFYGFPIQISIKPGLNESQSWKLLASPLNSLDDLLDLDLTGLPQLNNMDSFIPYICPVHFVPLNLQKASRYNTYTMDEDWFVNRVKEYVAKNNYYAPWQTTDTISLQFQTSGLTPVTVNILNKYGQLIGAIPMAVGATNAVLAPQSVWQGDYDLSDLALPEDGIIYLLAQFGTGQGMAQFISEGIQVKTYWYKTQCYEYTNSSNKQGTIFNGTPAYTPMVRMFSQINKYTPKSVFKTFVDEPQDITLLNNIPYDTWNLDIGFGSGLPDYMIRKMDRIFGLDTVFIDGVQYSRDENAAMEVKYTDGQPKPYGSLAIRKAQNSDGVVLNTAGQITDPQQAGYVLNADAFGSNDSTGQNLVQVTYDDPINS